MRLQHNRQWLRWVPILLWIAGVMWVCIAQGENFDVGISMALITGPVGLGIPILGAFMCHIPRTRRVYAGTALASGLAVAAMILVIVGASLLSLLGKTDGGFVREALRTVGEMMAMLAPLLMGAAATAVLMLVWMVTFPKEEEESK